MPYLKTSITICFYNFIVFHFWPNKNTTKKIKVNQDRIERIFELSKFGKDLNGKGYRVAFTKGCRRKEVVY
jgi:hypothetical protein